METSLLDLLERTRRIGTWSVDPSQELVHWSPVTYAIHEEDPAKPILLKDAIQYYVPEHRATIERCIEDSIARKEPWDVELQIFTSAGKRRWVRAIGEPVFAAGEVVRIHGIFEDIDERKSLAIERETLLERMLQGERIAKLGHWYQEVDGNTLEWSPGLHQIFGITDTDQPLSLEQHRALVHPEDRELFERTKQDAVASGRSYQVEYRVLIGDKEKHIYSEGFPRFDSNGKLHALTGVTMDHTGALESRRKIRELNRRLVLALDASGIGVWEWNINTNALIWDNRMYALYGINEDEFSGAYEAWQNGLHPDDRSEAEEQIAQAVATKTPFNAVFRVVWPNRTVRTIQGSADLILDRHGEPQRMIGVNWDITEDVTIRRELERSNQELAQFAYRTSHDLKGPLTSIRRVASYMYQDMDDGNVEEVKRNLERIRHRASAMETMVMGILDAAKAELTETSSEPIDIDEIVNDIIDSLQALREEKDVAVHTFIDCKTQPHLPYIRIYQILSNLISNGIKYADHSQSERFVNVRAHVTSDCLVLCVEDNGQGIPVTDSAAPYEMFRRFHADDSGSGLGLYIVKKHVESLNGKINLSSGDTGTRFDVEIPYTRRTT